jgi:DNA-directed RNA polymerase subunit RPC12/RpoP
VRRNPRAGVGDLRDPPNKGREGGVRRMQSLAGHRCPYCRAADLVFSAATRENACPACGGAVITEWEAARRGLPPPQEPHASRPPTAPG